ncbi:MAG: hypothetical protein AB1665_09105 [Candidatus Thermoplasmatota archaeon]
MVLRFGRRAFGVLLAVVGYPLFTISVFALLNMGATAGRVAGLILIFTACLGIFLTLCGVLLIYENLVMTVYRRIRLSTREEDEGLR